ncbi:MAG: helix-turn-helix transcriptional regulator [Candidatus Nanohaloarchaea archaeon]
MKKISLAVLLVLLASTAAATTVQSEQVKVDLATSDVNVNMHVSELTSSRFTYITSYPVEPDSVEVDINGKNKNCDLNPLQLGVEISCPTNISSNFTVDINFTGQQFVTDQPDMKVFRYSQSIYRPTKNYDLRVLLPAGAGLVNSANSSENIVSPPNNNIGSNGRRIYVDWHTEPELGDTLNFKVLFEEFSTSKDYLPIIAAALLIAIAGIVGYVTWRRKSRESVESLYEDLNQDQIEVLELIRENGGSMLQKDIVQESEYSKAKISGVVSELVDEEIIEKKKEGRSNKLTLSRKYSH